MAEAPVPITLGEFKRDAQAIGNGVVVLQTGWEALLESNQQAYLAEFVQRSRFTAEYPLTLSPSEFVDRLFQIADVAPSDNERAAAIQEFGAAITSADAGARGRALRRVAENQNFARRNSIGRSC